MKKIEDVGDLLGPVEMRRLLCPDAAGGLRPVASHRAIVERASGKPVGVVGAGYRLVTNEGALGYDRDCAARVFGATADDMAIFNVLAPWTRSLCRIDNMYHRADIEHAPISYGCFPLPLHSTLA